jgi:AcrR family transcriptional regulator
VTQQQDQQDQGGARERRKTETRAALVGAALEIVATEGFDAVTADQIAERAGVSRRTLFNYFPRVEDILTATIREATAETIDAVLARPAGEPLRESAFAVLETLLETPALAQVRALERAAERSPATRRFLLEFGDSNAEAFEEGLRRRLGEDVDPVYVSGLAAAVCGLLARVTRLVVAAGGTDAEMEQRHVAWIRRGLDHLFSGFDESAALPAASRTATEL